MPRPGLHKQSGARLFFGGKRAPFTEPSEAVIKRVPAKAG
jgi:hypothetical protein